MTTTDTGARVRAAHENAPSGGPLTPYKGERPEAPDWFVKAVETPYETGETDVNGTAIKWQRWGDPAKPGLLFVHGNGAHAHWWDFIAPYFLDHYQCVAFSFSGMGDSGWREEYIVSDYPHEIIAVAQATGLFDQEEKPILAAHSFGGFIARLALKDHGQLFKHAVIIDSYIPLPGEDSFGPPPRQNRNRIYPDLATALGRFRLAPPQSCENHFILDYIARWSLKKVDGGYTWRFDPNIWGRHGREYDQIELLRNMNCNVTFLNGADSVLVSEKLIPFIHEHAGSDTPVISVPHAQHHVWLDQPIAFVAALKAILARA